MATSGPSARPDGGTLAHKGGRKLAARIGDVLTTSVGQPAGEPTIAMDKQGAVYYAAIDVPRLAAIDVLRSEDRGKSWSNVSPKLGEQNVHPLSLDPYIYIDQKSQRVFTIDLTSACSYLSFSDNSGESWTTNPLACGRPVNDHQTLVSGPPTVSSPIEFPNVLYYCWNDLLASSCTKSLDGGLTFIPTGQPAFLGFDPAQEGGINGLPGVCGGLHGHAVVDSSGFLYVPRDYCGQPWLAISRDEGLSWERIQIANNGVNGLQAAGSNPSVAVDRKGNIYYGWVGKDRLPYLATSRDGGESWSVPVSVAVPDLAEANLFTLDVGDPGKLAFAYMGSMNSGYQQCHPQCGGSRAKTTWNGYLGATSDAFANKPLLVTGVVNDPRDPLKVGTCGPGRCGDTILDFLDVVIGKDGVANAAFVDACVDCTTGTLTDSGNEGFFSRLIGVPRLRR